MTKIAAIIKRRPQGLYWMTYRNSGKKLQLSSDEIAMAEEADGADGGTCVYLRPYEGKKFIYVAEKLDELYDRPVEVSNNKGG